MPKNLSEYRFNDWLQLRPLTHAIKTHRYREIDQRSLAVKPSGPEINSFRSLARNQQVVVVIAYNDEETIRLQSELVSRYLPHVLYAVVDNSSDWQVAASIHKFCLCKSIPYVRLEANPWNGKNPSRSHGFAMNWTWLNLIRPSEPYQFGFVDHDLFPTATTNPFRQLESCFCYGDKRWAGSRWFLWAGFCFFDYGAVLELPLDFGLDWFVGLDTGGANWNAVYQHLDARVMRDRTIRQVQVWPEVSTRDAYFEWRDDWLHEVGLDGRSELKPKKRLALRELLQSTCNP